MRPNHRHGMISKAAFSREAVLALTLAGLHLAPDCRPISPLLFGNNAWYQPTRKMWDVTAASGVGSIRIGGAGYDHNPLPKETLLAWVDEILKMGAQPIVQVSKRQTPAQAADLVRFLNIEKGRQVRYWSIGNESWLEWGRPADLEASAARIAAYWKPIASAMKKADPSVRIFGVSEAHALNPFDNIGPNPVITSLFGGKSDITGKDAEGRYYIDGFVWHHYAQTNPPGAAGENLPYAGFEGYKVRAETAVQVIATANAKAGRQGEDALQWAIGEFNATGKYGGVKSFGNGQMFALILGEAMKHGAAYAATWSMLESGGDGGLWDYSSMDADHTPRSSYRHIEMLAKNFSGEYVAATSGSDEVIAHGCRHGDTAGVLLVNRGAQGRRYHLDLGGGNAPGGTGTLSIRIEAGMGMAHGDSIGPRETQVLVFSRKESRKLAYNNADLLAKRPPRVTLFPPLPVALQGKGLAPRRPGAEPVLRRKGAGLALWIPGPDGRTLKILSPQGRVLEGVSP